MGRKSQHSKTSLRLIEVQLTFHQVLMERTLPKLTSTTQLPLLPHLTWTATVTMTMYQNWKPRMKESEPQTLLLLLVYRKNLLVKRNRVAVRRKHVKRCRVSDLK